MSEYRPHYGKYYEFQPSKPGKGEATQNLQLLYEEAVRLAESGHPVGHMGPLIENAQKDVQDLTKPRTVFKHKE